MAQKSERVAQMKKEFMRLHQEGKTNAEIADHFSLHVNTIYLHLQSIADANNVTRDSLLQVVHKPHETQGCRMTKHLEPVDIQDIRNSFSNIRKNIANIQSNIDNILKEEGE